MVSVFDSPFPKDRGALLFDSDLSRSSGQTSYVLFEQLKPPTQFLQPRARLLPDPSLASLTRPGPVTV